MITIMNYHTSMTIFERILIKITSEITYFLTFLTCLTLLIPRRLSVMIPSNYLSMKFHRTNFIQTFFKVIDMMISGKRIHHWKTNHSSTHSQSSQTRVRINYLILTRVGFKWKTWKIMTKSTQLFRSQIKIVTNKKKRISELREKRALKIRLPPTRNRRDMQDRVEILNHVTECTSWIRQCVNSDFPRQKKWPYAYCRELFNITLDVMENENDVLCKASFTQLGTDSSKLGWKWSISSKTFSSKTTIIKNHFYQKPLSSKTTFIKIHFHQEPLSSKNPKPYRPKPQTLIPP